ncbi:hypothetical protein JL720_4054 [Aureococcus anophagefferens]|nr:hypothetical protein JL720_4054 [Aureococcus anophagefferens]
MGDENVEPSEETNLAASKLQASIRGHQERANPTKPPLKASAAAPGSAGGAPVIVQNDADEQWPPYADPEYVMPETIEVLVLGPDGEERAVVTVDVAKCTTRKPYLGGYRHKKTGKVYHHASCQSAEFGLLPQRKNVECLRNRDTQTYETKTRSAQSNREYGTQMKREDLLMDDRGDVVRASRRYFTAAQLLELKRQKTQVLQCFWRGYLARRRTWGIRQRLYDAQVAEERGADEAGRAASRRRQFEVERRINPRSAKDFELLYNELEAWRAKEMERVRAIPDATPGDVKAAMSDVLAKETKALQTIDRLKAQAAKEGKARARRARHGTDGFPQEELRDLYRGLATDRLPPDERLQILLNVKWTVQEFACPLTHDIVELCDREADLLNRGRNEKSLEGLRKRTETLFQQFIETPDFNPESTRFLKVPTLRQMNATLAPTAE